MLNQFIIRATNSKVGLSVPPHLWPIAEHYRQSLSDGTQLDVMLMLMRLIISSAHTKDSLEFLAIVVDYFNTVVLQKNDIHVLVQQLPDQSNILCTYFEALQLIPAPLPESSLLKAVAVGAVKLFAVFGGQGNVEAYFEELESLFIHYNPIAMPFFLRAARTLAAHSESDEALQLHATPIPLMAWLEGNIQKPSIESLLATHLSLPLIGLVQLLNYYIVVKLSGKSIRDWQIYWKGIFFSLRDYWS